MLVVGNHDSHWDPVAVGVAAIRRRQIRALAKSTLWDVRGLSPVLDGMGQIPIERGAGDAGALSRAIEELRAGACIGVFPEGTRSRGEVLRARSGVGRLALEVPEAKLVCVAIEGTSDLTGFPRRPRLRVRFFEPRGGQARPEEEPGEIAVRLVEEIRELVQRRLGLQRFNAVDQRFDEVDKRFDRPMPMSAPCARRWKPGSKSSTSASTRSTRSSARSTIASKRWANALKRCNG